MSLKTKNRTRDHLAADVLGYSSTLTNNDGSDVDSDGSDTFDPLTASRSKCKSWRTFRKRRNQVKEAIPEPVQIDSASSSDNSSNATVIIDHSTGNAVLSTTSITVFDDEGGEGDWNNLSSGMFGGGHKRNLDIDLRPSDAIHCTSPMGVSSSVAGSSAENLNSHEDQPIPKRLKIPDYPITSDSSSEPEDHFNLGEIGKFSKELAVWNEEFEGCFVSRSRNNNSVCGLIRLNGNTIRPFGRVESKQPMQIIVLRGEVVVKSIAVTQNSKNQLVCQSLTCKEGDWAVLPGGVPFSLENHTDSVIELGYSCYDV